MANDPTLAQYGLTSNASALKQTLYDWNGLNLWLFQQVNAIRGHSYDALMLFITHIGNHHLFPYYMAGLMTFVALALLCRKIQKKGGNKHFLSVWVGVLLVLAVSYVITGMLVTPLKNHFAYPRPYIAVENVVGMDRKPDGTDDYHSFPSGHATFITMMILGIWPAFSRMWKLAGGVLLLAVLWSRMALGMHFPADLVGGFVLSFCVVMIARAILYPILRRGFGLTC